MEKGRNNQAVTMVLGDFFMGVPGAAAAAAQVRPLEKNKIVLAAPRHISIRSPVAYTIFQHEMMFVRHGLFVEIFDDLINASHGQIMHETFIILYGSKVIISEVT